MKNKFLCLLLCAFLVFGSFIFSACDKGYNLKNFNADYVAIAKQEGINLNNSGCLAFDFSKIKEAIIAKDGNGNASSEDCEVSLRKYFEPLANDENGYYGYLTKNSQVFLVYVKEMLASGNNVNKDVRNNIKSQLDALNVSAVRVNGEVKEFVRVINASSSDEDRLPYFNNIISALCGFYSACRDLSFNVSNVFFNDILNNENYNYYANSNGYASRLYSNLPDIAYMHVFNLTQNFVEIYVEGNTALKTAEFDEYKLNVERIVGLLNGLKNSHLVESDNLYNNVMAMYAVNGVLINEKTIYQNACNNVVYYEVVTNGKSDYTDEANVNIIYGYKQNLDGLTTVLLDILSATEVNL